MYDVPSDIGPHIKFDADGPVLPEVDWSSAPEGAIAYFHFPWAPGGKWMFEADRENIGPTCICDWNYELDRGFLVIRMTPELEAAAAAFFDFN